MIHKISSSVAAILLVTVCGCNSYDVRALKYDPGLKEVVVINNPSVIVSDFEDVLEDEFGARGIAVKHAPSGYSARKGEYIITYNARQSWDFTTYLSDASVRVRKDDLSVARGRYHHNGGSCSLSPWKWQGTAAKMGPLYERLLKEYAER